MSQTDHHCPCGSQFPYNACCAPLHAGIAKAQTAEQLMRSRYAAFVKGLPKYLIKTRAPAMRENNDFQDLKQMIANTEWLGLEIIDTEMGTAKDQIGEVEFIARYASNGQVGQLHERSRFIKEKATWYYLDGDIKQSS